MGSAAAQSPASTRQPCAARWLPLCREFCAGSDSYFCGRTQGVAGMCAAAPNLAGISRELQAFLRRRNCAGINRELQASSWRHPQAFMRRRPIVQALAGSCRHPCGSTLVSCACMAFLLAWPSCARLLLRGSALLRGSDTNTDKHSIIGGGFIYSCLDMGITIIT